MAELGYDSALVCPGLMMGERIDRNAVGGC